MSTAAKNSPGLLRAPGISLHRQLFLVLRQQIGRGAYAAGTPLPTEEELCEQYGVSRITVRRALQDLASQGFVERRQGRGTYVAESAPVAREAPLSSLVQDLQKVAADTEVDIIDIARREPPASVAISLRLEAGAEAIYALRVRRRGEVPLMLTESWLPERFGRTVTAATLRKEALYALLLRSGVKFGRVIQELTAEAANPLHARLLKTDIGAPLIRIKRLVHDASASPIQLLTVHLSPERSRVLADIPAAEIDTYHAGAIAHDVSPPEPAHARQGRRAR